VVSPRWSRRASGPSGRIWPAILRAVHQLDRRPHLDDQERQDGRGRPPLGEEHLIPRLRAADGRSVPASSAAGSRAPRRSTSSTTGPGSSSWSGSRAAGTATRPAGKGLVRDPIGGGFAVSQPPGGVGGWRHPQLPVSRANRALTRRGGDLPQDRLAEEPTEGEITDERGRVPRTGRSQLERREVSSRRHGRRMAGRFGAEGQRGKSARSLKPRPRPDRMGPGSGVEDGRVQ